MKPINYRKLEDALTHEMHHLREALEKEVDVDDRISRNIYMGLIMSYDRILKEIAQ